MFGFNWPQWLSRVVSSPDCRRARHGRANPERTSTETLEPRTLLSSQNLVTNVNDPPVVADATLSVAENSPDGTVVGEVSASDPDAGTLLQYAITSGNAAGAFEINAYTGQVSVKNGQLLNFESRPTYFLTMSVTDNGQPGLSSSAQLTIQLIDVNDPPIITFAPVNGKYRPGDSSVRFGAKATISDDDGPVIDFTGLVLNVSITNGRSNKDILSIKDTGEKAKKIVTRGTNVVFGKMVIGTVQGGRGTEPTLSITFNSAATKASVEALIRALSFSTRDTSTTMRTLKVQMEDPEGHVLSTTARYIQIKKVKKEPPGWGFY